MRTIFFPLLMVPMCLAACQRAQPVDQTCRPVTEGPVGDPSCSNQVDDDCDGLTDAADNDCVECGGDRDCADQDLCTRDLCQQGVCSHPPAPDGTSCDDNLWCTVNERCQSGICVTDPRDCSDLDTNCRAGVCREEADECGADPLEDGTPCEPDDVCTSAPDSCQSGVCTGGAPDKDSDGDGYLDALCTGNPEDDCDDTRADVHPGIIEIGLPDCGDGADNDCDGQTDDDPGCLVTGLSNEFNWSWLHPKPQGEWINTVWAVAPGEVWMGTEGRGLRFDGDEWTLLPDGVRSVRDVWFESPGRGWYFDAAASIRKIDGSEITVEFHALDVGIYSLGAIFGLDADHIWAVGGQGGILYRRQGVWEQEYSTTGLHLTGVWGCHPEDLWAVGQDGVILHRTASGWTRWPQSAPAKLTGIWGLSADDIRAVGWDGTLAHYDGEGWSFQHLEGGPDLQAVWGAADTGEWWAAGQYGALYHHDGNHWQAGFLPLGDPQFPRDRLQFDAVSGTSSRDVWVAGASGVIFHYAEHRWSRVTRIEETEFSAAWLADPATGETWLVGDRGVWYYDGELTLIWQKPEAMFLSDVCGLPDERVLVVGGRGLSLTCERETGCQQQGQLDQFPGLNGVWCNPGSGNAWAVGDQGTILKFQDGGWALDHSAAATTTFNDVWGLGDASDRSIWVVGRSDLHGGVIFEKISGSWLPAVETPVVDDILAITGASESDIWLATSGGVWNSQGDGWTGYSIPWMFVDVAYGPYGVLAVESTGRLYQVNQQGIEPVECGLSAFRGPLWAAGSVLYGLVPAGGLVRRD